jgi:hypothetical protein
MANATCAGRFGDCDISGARHLRNREAQVLKMRDILPVSVIPTRHLNRQAG